MSSNRPLNRRDFLKLTGITAGALALAACAAPGAAPEAGDSGEAAPASEGIELIFWGFADNRNKWYEALTVDFKAQMPDVTIKIESLPYAEMHDKVATTLVAGTGAPDIADIEIGRFGSYCRGERVGFVDVTELIGADKENMYLRSALAPWAWQGKNYGIGNELNACLLYYRHDIMSDLGLETPFKTWEDLTAAGKAYNEQTGKALIAPADNDTAYWWIMSSGGGGFFNENGEVVFDNTLSKRVLQQLHDWVYVDKIGILAPGGNMYNETYYGAMGAGDFVVQLGAPWYQGFMKDNVQSLEGKWHMQFLPTFSDGEGAPSATHGGTGTCITEQCKNPEAAWAFIKFCNLTSDSVLKGFEMVNLFPTWKPAWSDPRMQFEDKYFDNQKPAEFISVAGDQMPPQNNSPYWPEVTRAFTDLVLNPVMLDQKDVETAMAEGLDEAKKALEG
jgi:arabinosaccharide transport system substrate-binding protein